MKDEVCARITVECLWREASIGVCVHNSKTHLRRERPDEAERVVLENVVKIWVKTGSFTALRLTQTLLPCCLVLSVVLNPVQA